MINDITDKDIGKLNDTELRELIGKLCEATLDKNHIDTVCVTYGGNQDEPDGGVDVRVKSNECFGEDWAIPRNNTIIQVKKPKMPPSEIEKEMINKEGNVLESIKELVSVKGAYIIASSGDNLTDKKLKNRIDKMKSLMSEIDKDGNVKLNFYDSKRIATWTNQFPSIIIWVNERTNNRTIGWSTYYNWSNPNEIEKGFIIDEDIFLHKDNFDKNNKRTIIEGINEIRNLLSQEKKVVRLAGLSGVGKTRFAQALFDKNIGKNPLNKDSVIYCDISNEPKPVPITFIQELLLLQKRVILIVDNCDKELHNKLAEFTLDSSSKISLLTIEYDVKENTDIESYNYYLDTSSDNTIRKLLKRDFDYIEDSNIETIVKCSDGNFRIARYLAKTIDKNESIGTLREETLFERLFYQNNEKNSDLLDTGRVASIFISFNVEYNVDDSDNELNILSNIIEKSPLELSRNIGELSKRQIIQSRGNMRAVLPHAIANRLADELLSLLPINFIINEIKKSRRLELSFFRRLKFLHDKEYSKKIVDIYLENCELEKVDKLEIEILQCIKVISPEKLLYKIEQIDNDNFFTRDNINYYDWANILAYIAYDQESFSRAVMLLIKFAKSEKKGESYNSIRNIVYKLFHIVLSGTHATIDERLKIVDILIKSSCEIENDLAFKLIDELLETGGFVEQIINEETSRKRDYGYIPKTQEEYRLWYITILKYCELLILNKIFKEKIKEIVTNNFRNIASCGFYNELENLVKKVLENETWPQVWISIGVIKHFDKNKVPKEMLIRMNKLQEECKPQTIEDKIITYLSKGKHIYWTLDDIYEDEERNCEIIKELGRSIAKENMQENLLKIDNSCDLYRVGLIADGLYKEVDNNKELIFFLLSNINMNNDRAYFEIISNYLALMNKTGESDAILDEILQNEKYNKYYPKVQFGFQLKQNDIERVQKAIRMSISPIQDYYRIGYCLANINTEKVIETLKLLPKCNESDDIIISTLHILYHNKRKDENIDVYARNCIAELDYKDRNNMNNHINYEIKQIAEESFSKENGEKQAEVIFEKLVKLIKEKGISYYEYSYILKHLVKIYPTTFLDKIFTINKDEEFKIRYFVKGYGFHENIIDEIDQNILIQWMEKNKKILEISYIINPIEKKDSTYKWKKISRYLFENYIDNQEIINNLIRGIYPTSWSDKYSSVLEKRLPLTTELESSNNEKIKRLGNILKNNLIKEIHRRKQEEEKEQDVFNTFE